VTTALVLSGGANLGAAQVGALSVQQAQVAIGVLQKV